MIWVQAIILGALAAVWLWVLGRPLIRSLFNMARRDPVGHFNRNMSVLGQAPQKSLAYRQGSVGANNLRMARQRRLQIFLALCIAVVVSAGLAIAFRGLFIWNNVIMDVLLVGYTLMAAKAGAELNQGQPKRGRSQVSYIGPSEPDAAGTSVAAVAER